MLGSNIECQLSNYDLERNPKRISKKERETEETSKQLKAVCEKISVDNAFK